MGLNIGVGILRKGFWDDDPDDEPGTTQRECRAMFRRVNVFLRGNNLPAHEEPTVLPRFRVYNSGFGYSQIHYLRRFAAHHYENPKRRPRRASRTLGPSQDPILDKHMTPVHHLLYHADYDGLYVPIDFPLVLEDPTCEFIPGWALGSSVRLLDELRELAEPLGVALKRGHLPRKEKQAIDQDPARHPYRTERWVWLTLFDFATLSVKFRTAIYFY